MLVGYVRVSTLDQSIDRQINILEEAGVDCRNIYREKITGTKRDRPALNTMINELKAGDTVITTELTRLSRSSKDLFDIVDKIQEKGADIKSVNESWLNTTTPQGKLMFTIFGGLAQFERDLTSQRTKEGLKAALARGRKGGRPSKQNEKHMIVELLYNKGIKINDIAKQTDLSRSTVSRILRNVKNKDTKES